jgi:hypothetical protein
MMMEARRSECSGVTGGHDSSKQPCQPSSAVASRATQHSAVPARRSSISPAARTLRTRVRPPARGRIGPERQRHERARPSRVSAPSPHQHRHRPDGRPARGPGRPERLGVRPHLAAERAVTRFRQLLEHRVRS